MSKRSNPQPNPSQTVSFCGIDVSAASLAVAVLRPDEAFDEREFDNTTAGHAALIAWLGKRKTAVRVSLEATGSYSLDLALALHGAASVQLAVLNPKTAKSFARMLNRSKTDRADAQALAQYSARMSFVAWCPPTLNQLQLRVLCRHIDGRIEQRTRERNRLHAASQSATTPRVILRDLQRSIALAERQIAALRRAALAMVQADDGLRRNFDLLVGLPGVASIAAMQLLAELPMLSDNASIRQLTAMAGIDPSHQTSGTSLHRSSKISRAGNANLRRTLFLAAWVASRHDPHLKTFYQDLLGRHKARKQALIAVARKLLHAIYGVLKTQTPYQGSKLFPNLNVA